MSTSGVEPADRRPMTAAAVGESMVRPDRWQVRHVLRTASTNDDLARGNVRPAGRVDGPVVDGQRADGPVVDGPGVHQRGGIVLVTEEQTAGRGRAGRQWSCPPGAGLMFSVQVRAAGIPPARRAWVGVALGLSVVGGFAAVARTGASLKWPNDVLVGGSKCGGILAESVGESVVVGAGLNISLTRAELPRADATSLALEGAGPVDRNRLLGRILDDFGDLLDGWLAAGGDVDSSGLRARYLAACSTVGSSVRIELPGGAAAVGTAVDVAADGAIVVQRADGLRTRFSAGDVVHLRPGPPADR